MVHSYCYHSFFSATKTSSSIIVSCQPLSAAPPSPPSVPSGITIANNCQPERSRPIKKLNPCTTIQTDKQATFRNCSGETAMNPHDLTKSFYSGNIFTDFFLLTICRYLLLSFLYFSFFHFFLFFSYSFSVVLFLLHHFSFSSFFFFFVDQTEIVIRSAQYLSQKSKKK